MHEYRFVCIDAGGRWQDVRYATLSSDAEAHRLGSALLREFDAVLVYQGERKLTMFAQVA